MAKKPPSPLQAFAKHLNRASHIVATWPEAKKEVLGGECKRPLPDIADSFDSVCQALLPPIANVSEMTAIALRWMRLADVIVIAVLTRKTKETPK